MKSRFIINFRREYHARAEETVGMFERYSEDARLTVVHAKHEADGFGSSEIGAEHILLALLRDSALISSAMETLAVAGIRATIHAHIPRREPNPLPHDLPLSAEGRIVLTSAAEEANKCGHKFVKNEHILLAVLQSENTYAAELLKQNGLSSEDLRTHIVTSLTDQ